MFYLKTKYFARWAKKEGIPDSVLRAAIREFESGLFEVSLGNHLFKKRIPLKGSGKRGGQRTIIFYQRHKKLIFCFGFSKSQQENVSGPELKMLHKISDVFQAITKEWILKNIKRKEFIEIPMLEDNDEK